MLAQKQGASLIFYTFNRQRPSYQFWTFNPLVLAIMNEFTAQLFGLSLSFMILSITVVNQVSCNINSKFNSWRETICSADHFYHLASLSTLCCASVVDNWIVLCNDNYLSRNNNIHCCSFSAFIHSYAPQQLHSIIIINIVARSIH